MPQNQRKVREKSGKWRIFLITSNFYLYILVNVLVENNVRFSFFHIYVKRTEFFKYYV